MSARLLIMIFLVVTILAPASAHAYMDPGTGSLFIQGLIAAVLGVGLTLKLYWRRIRKVLSGKVQANKPAGDDESDADA